MDFLTNDPDHAGVTDEQMEQFFAAHPDLRPLSSVQGVPPVGGELESETPSQPPSAPPTTPEPASPSAPATPGEGEPTAPDPATGEPPATPSEPVSPTIPEPDDFVEIEGSRYPRSQVQAATQFQQHLASDPQLQQLITDYLTGGGIPQQPTQPQRFIPPQQASPQALSQPPEDLDLEDPSVRRLYQLVQQQNEAIQGLTQGLTTTYEQSAAQSRQQINSQWQTAATAFSKDHDLREDETEYLGQVAARLGVLPALMQGMDPITGSPSSPDPIRAFNRALEIAMFQVPEYRDREFRRSVQAQQQEAQKRKLLGAVGGSSGSVARTNPPPKAGSPEARKAMLSEVGAMLNGEWSDPTAN
jgi:hypothetical protein